jgi:hypothetical protein
MINNRQVINSKSIQERRPYYYLIKHIPKKDFLFAAMIVESTRRTRRAITKDAPHWVVEKGIRASLNDPGLALGDRSAHDCMQACGADDSSFERVHIEIAHEDCSLMTDALFRFLKVACQPGTLHGLTEVACWAHARRKFFEARPNAPREANEILQWIQQLYDIEDRACDLTPEQRQALRQRESVPILDWVEKKLDDLSNRILPKSALGKAVTYARNQWAALRRYVSDGRLTIDNNVSERTLRLQAIGRNN